jgi:hypothetical protein
LMVLLLPAALIADWMVGYVADGTEMAANA